MQQWEPRPEKPPPYSYAVSGTNSDEYEYEPIEAGQLRLLSLNEAASFDEPLECDIACFPIAAGPGRPDYTALSYVWGAQISSHEVRSDDKILVIGANLDAALRHLRRRDRPVVLWVDALCIDQRNVAERNHQVSLMRSIFRAAEETIVYLGDPGGYVSLSAWNFLERQSAWGLNADHERDYSRPAMLEEATEFRGDLHDVCHDVLSRAWFTRVWVFQEAVVSKTVSLQCGHRRIPWDDFVKATVRQPRRHDLYGESLRQQDLFESVSRIWEARVAFHVSQHQVHNLPRWYEEEQQRTPGQDKNTSTDILDMMVRARGLEATDPRDKIFALLGLSTGFDWAGLGTIDYGRSVAGVYTAFARDVMTARDDYKALSYLGRKPSPDGEPWVAARAASITAHRDPHSPASPGAAAAAGPDDVPSWVADWTHTHAMGYAPRAIMEVVAAQSPDPTGRRTADFRAWLPADVLAVHGRVVGVVEGVLKASYLQGKDELYFDNLRTQWPKSAHSRQYPLESYILAKWDNLLHARDGYVRRPPSTAQVMGGPRGGTRRPLDVSVRQLLARAPGAHHRRRRAGSHKSAAYRPFVDIDTCPPTPGSIEAHLVARGRKTVEWSDTSWPVEEVVRDRSSIIDERYIGHFVRGDDAAADDAQSPQCALLPPTAQLGDLVVCFPGAQVPFLLRPCSRDENGKELYEAEEYWKGLAATKLSHLNGSERFIWGHILGECWINGFDEVARENKNDGLFMII